AQWLMISFGEDTERYFFRIIGWLAVSHGFLMWWMYVDPSVKHLLSSVVQIDLSDVRVGGLQYQGRDGGSMNQALLAIVAFAGVRYLRSTVSRGFAITLLTIALLASGLAARTGLVFGLVYIGIA